MFTSDDFLEKKIMGDVEADSGTGKEVETWKNAPLITLKGKKIKEFDPVEESIRGA